MSLGVQLIMGHHYFVSVSYIIFLSKHSNVFITTSNLIYLAHAILCNTHGLFMRPFH